MRRTITAEMKAEVGKRFNDGEAAKELATEFDIDLSTVYEWGKLQRGEAENAVQQSVDQFLVSEVGKVLGKSFSIKGKSKLRTGLMQWVEEAQEQV